MIKVRTEEFTWFLENEGFIPAVRDIAHPDGERRSYRVCEHDGAKLFIKTFSEKGLSGRVRSLISPRGKTEFIVARKLNALGVPAPLPLGYGIGARTSAIAEYFIDGRTFLGIFESSSNRDPLLEQLADFLHLLKKANVRHDDLHLDNILVSGDIFYLVDLHKAKVRASFRADDELANLTHALGMVWHDLSPGERAAFFDRYQLMPSMKSDLEKAIRSLREKWVLNKMARAFRDTSIVHRNGTRLFIRGREGSGGGVFVEILKNDRKVKVERHGDHIRKTYTGTRRLKTAWRNHVVLEYMHTTITPVVYYAEVPETGHGYIAMEDLADRGEELDRYLDRNYDAMDAQQRISFIALLAHFFLAVTARGIAHKDLKACNIFVLTKGGFLFLDVEDIHFASVTPDVLKRLFCQLNNTVPKRISARDRMRFYLRLISLIDCDKKQLFKDIITESMKDKIVHEGTSGLVIDSWK